MDYDDMSVEELQALLGQEEEQAPQGVDYDAMSAEELQSLLGQEDEVVNEQYEPIQGGDRFAIKNFGGDKQGIMNYLHKGHPESEFKYGSDGEVLGRDRGSSSWRKMDVDSSLFDPSTWELQDISDLTTDIGGGVAETAAGLAAGTAGMVATPAGALAAGAAGAGAAGAGIETLKQGIAKYLGTREEMSGKDVAIAGGTSAVMAPLFGIGGGGKLVKKVAEMGLEGAEKQAALKLAQRAEEGLLTSAIKSGASNLKGKGQGLANMLSGVGKKDFKTYFNNFDELEGMSRKDAFTVADDLFSSLTEGVDKAKKTVSDSYEALKTSGKSVDISSTADEFAKRKMKAVREIDHAYRNKPEVAQRLKRSLDDMEMSMFGIGKDVNMENAINLEKVLKSYRSNTDVITDPIEKDLARYTNSLSKDLSGFMTKDIDNAMKYGLDQGTYTQLKKQWQAAKALEDVAKKTKDPATMFGNLMGIDTKAGKKMYNINELVELTDELGIPFETTARKLRAWSLLKDPSWMPTSGTATSTSRSILGSGVGGTLGFAMGGGNPVTAAAGAALGSVAGSPASMKAVGKLGAKAGRAGSKALQAGTSKYGQGATRTMWNSIRNSEY